MSHFTFCFFFVSVIQITIFRQIVFDRDQWNVWSFIMISYRYNVQTISNTISSFARVCIAQDGIFLKLTVLSNESWTPPSPIMFTATKFRWIDCLAKWLCLLKNFISKIFIILQPFFLKCVHKSNICISDGNRKRNRSEDKLEKNGNKRW